MNCVRQPTNRATERFAQPPGYHSYVGRQRHGTPPELRRLGSYLAAPRHCRRAEWDQSGRVIDRPGCRPAEAFWIAIGNGRRPCRRIEATAAVERPRRATKNPWSTSPLEKIHPAPAERLLRQARLEWL